MVLNLPFKTVTVSAIRAEFEISPLQMEGCSMLVLTWLLLGPLVTLDTVDGSSQAAHWYRGNLHTHSLWSDGDDFPEMIVEEYATHRYHFLALSDHNILSRGDRWMYASTIEARAKAGALAKYLKRFGPEWVETRGEGQKQEVRLKPLSEFRGKFEEPGKFLLIEGEEITSSFQRLPVHINATNVKSKIPPQRGASVRDVIRNTLRQVIEQSETSGQPILAHVNHPNFGYAITAEDLAHVVEERFFEVYNGHPSVHHRGDAKHCGVERMWDIANAIRLGVLGAAPLYGLATDDSHNYHAKTGSLTRRGWVVVRAKELTARSLIAAMEAGDFYSSSGVTLKDVRFDAKARTLKVVIDPAPGATYTVDFVGTKRDFDRASEPQQCDEGKPLTGVTRNYSEAIGEVFQSVDGVEATYRLTGEELYVRAVVTSSLPVDRPVWEGQKRKAWTQPVSAQ